MWHWDLRRAGRSGKAEDTVDVSRVITEEDTTERGEGADEVRLPGHGSLDAIDIAGGRERSSAARHGCRWMTGSVELKMVIDE